MIGVNDLKKVIDKSHRRCVNYDIDKKRVFPIRTLSAVELHKALDEDSELIKISIPFMEILYDFLRGSGFALYLTNSEGFILTIVGDEEIIKDMAQIGIVEGADMSEKSTGTNAIGTALYEDCSVQTSGKDHYIEAYHPLTCSAAVIHNEKRKTIGCLNLTGKCKLAHPHTLGLVVAAVKSIENQLKVEKTQNELFNAYQYLNKVMDSINSGIFALNTNGVIKAINKSACTMLCVREEVINKKVYEILNNWREMLREITEGKIYEGKEVTYTCGDKKKIFSLNAYPIKNKIGDIIGIVGIFNDIQNVYNLVNKYTGKNATYTFQDIIGKSEKILELKREAESIANSPSTVLIQGESGTGKELIAQAIHNSSSRRDKSFVAINCGAIPKSLIESELFGYERGAFTGAKQGGHPGKFELANGGTLFLDEIGEMPLDVQVHFLRILQTSCFYRVGGSKNISVDVRIIAATNENLKGKVEKGTFREDLYYRLSVIPINVPPLRERNGDVEILIQYFLKTKAVKLGKSIPKMKNNIYRKLIDYTWPGNVRELENCIENIVNMDGNTSFDFEGDFSIEKQNNVSQKILEYNMCSLEQWDKIAIKRCIEKCNGNITKAAKILEINRSTIYSKMKKNF
ncbi:sigma-54-dependent Fis family transcriptional regulator [Clostridium scatologenes]|uniref:Sigma-54 dependent transcription regulator n=1 Tax=Clostridium scatologenes TaxID=1548 RepID=A0A0E3M5J8_CLOSL|nr:sigma-54-dependent Fis family transcriptional regulator [Clostridium scatologenes]AKA68228.1 sigma-54 dependent transcription regulator [Clostridium scatologenes]